MNPFVSAIGDKSAMRPFVKLLWTHYYCYYYDSSTSAGGCCSVCFVMVRQRSLVFTLRRCCRFVVLVSLLASFLVSLTLLLTFIVADDSTWLCHADDLQGQGQGQGHSSSVLRQLHIALDNDKLPVYTDRHQPICFDLV